jgi:tRNA (adenine57-N1/adenine58-N1)-methyltransferase
VADDGPDTPDADAGETDGQAYLLVALDHDREYLRRPGDRLETDLGVLTVPADVSAGDRLDTHLGEPFAVRALRGPDLFDHLERTGAPMLPRDVGLVLGLTGAGAGDRGLDAGTGTGVLAVYLGNVGVDLTTYERDPEFAAVARENVARAGVGDRVEVRTGDLLADVEQLTAGEPFDLLTLDTGDAAAVVERAPALLADGGFAVAYCPFVERAREVERAAREAGLRVETRETIQREMDFDDRGSRPSTAGVGHTGYLVLARHLRA